MDNPSLSRLCPHCFIVETGERCRACGGGTEAFGGAAGAPMVVGRLRVLSGAPGLADLVANWSGPRRFPRSPWGPAEPATVCRHHGGRMIWLWESYWPDAFAGPGRARALCALRHSRALMLELPRPEDQNFRAAFARNGPQSAPAGGPARAGQDPADAPGRPELPEAAGLVADLDQALDAVGARPRRIAVVHPDPAAARLAQLRAQWCHRGCEIECETDAQRAIDWCIGDLPPPERRARAGGRRRGVLDVGVLDLGGWLGRGLVAGLHRLVPGSYPELRLLEAAADPVALRQLRQESLKDLPAPLLSAPPWRGVVRRGWWRRTELRVTLIEDLAARPPMLAALVVGDNRLNGEQLLARLLDLDYGRQVPVLLLHDARSDGTLLKWAEQEFGVKSRKFDSEPAAARAMQLLARCL